MPDQWHPGGKLVCHRIDARDIQRFIDAHLRQNAGHRACKQCLSGAWGSDEKTIMAPGRCYFECALDVFLSLDLAEVCGDKQRLELGSGKRGSFSMCMPGV